MGDPVTTGMIIGAVGGAVAHQVGSAFNSIDSLKGLQEYSGTIQAMTM